MITVNVFNKEGVLVETFPLKGFTIHAFMFEDTVWVGPLGGRIEVEWLSSK